MTSNSIRSDDEVSMRSHFTIVCFIAIALYNVIELNVIIFSTFKNRRSLYFWSFLVSTWGVALNGIGYLIRDFKFTQQSAVYCTLLLVGWCSMVTGQSVVLYSRLHLILRNSSTLRMVLGMIIVNAVICHVPVIALVWGANSSNPTPYLIPYSIYEKVQITIFFVQELIISGLYIVHTVRILQPEGNIRGEASRKAMTHLIYVNAVIVLLDVTILALEYSGLYEIQTAYKAFVYSLKLKLEFSILNQLVSLTKSGTSGYLNSRSQTQPEERKRSMHMETFDGTLKSRRDRQSRQLEQRGGYRAYILSSGLREEDIGSAERIVGKEDGAVMLTTVIAVRSDAIEPDREADCDLERGRSSRCTSIGEESVITATTVEAGETGDEGRDISAELSSSQIQLARSEI